MSAKYTTAADVVAACGAGVFVAGGPPPPPADMSMNAPPRDMTVIPGG